MTRQLRCCRAMRRPPWTWRTRPGCARTWRPAAPTVCANCSAARSGYRAPCHRSGCHAPCPPGTCRQRGPGARSCSRRPWPEQSRPPAARAEAPGRSWTETVHEGREISPADRAGRNDARSARHNAYSTDVLSIQVANAPLTAVLEEIAHQSGAAIRGEASVRGVSASFEDVPLPDALVRLLGEQNFTLRYDSDGKLRTIDLLGEPLPLAAAQTTRTDASNPDKSAGRHGHHGVQFSRETLPDGQVLVSVAGTDTGGATKGSARR